MKSISDDTQTQPEGHGMSLGKSQNLEFLRSGPSGMYMDAICMLWKHGMCCMDMLYVFWGWNMLYGHGICFLEMEYAV